MLGGGTSKKQSLPSFRRYTDILSVIDMYRHCRITLTSPAGWGDRNDRHAMQRYAARHGAPGALALCVTGTRETYHHWHVFAGSRLGACVVFDRKKLITLFDSRPEIVHGPVRYVEASDLNKLEGIAPHEYPFLKRKVFADEREYRAVALMDPWATPHLNLTISPSVIRRVVLGPDIPEQLMQTLEEVIRSCDGFQTTPIHFSRMPENKKWRDAFDKVTWQASDAPDYYDANA